MKNRICLQNNNKHLRKIFECISLYVFYHNLTGMCKIVLIKFHILKANEKRETEPADY